jgi:hypothetical protein
MRLCLPARRTNLGSTTAISTRVRAQIASTVSFAFRVPATRVQTLSLQEMFVLCQQHGFEVDITTVMGLPTGDQALMFGEVP